MQPGQPDLIIGIVSGKGGVGKTTLATHIAKSCMRLGKRVLLLDTDSKKSTSARRWAKASEAMGQEAPVTIAIDGDDLPGHIAALGQNYDVVVVDGTPDLAGGTAATMGAVDVIISPVEASHFSLWELEDTYALFQRVQAVKPSVRFFAIFNKAKTSGDESWAHDTLSARGIPFLPCSIADRIVFRRVLDVGEEAKSAAARDIQQFVGCLFDALRETAA